MSETTFYFLSAFAFITSIVSLAGIMIHAGSLSKHIPFPQKSDYAIIKTVVDAIKRGSPDFVTRIDTDTEGIELKIYGGSNVYIEIEQIRNDLYALLEHLNLKVKVRALVDNKEEAK